MRQLKKRVARFHHLSFAEHCLLARATFVVASVRIVLVLLPLHAARWLAALLSKAAGRHRSAQLVWAVTASSRYIPGATCLAQALSLQALLAHSGYASQVSIGVSRPDAQRLEAHAWLTSGGEVLIGGPEITHYVPITVLEPQEQSYAA